MPILSYTNYIFAKKKLLHRFSSVSKTICIHWNENVNKINDKKQKINAVMKQLLI